VTITRPIAGLPADVAREYERVIRAALDGEDVPLDVQFGTWVAEDGRLQVVCRVETPPADPFALEAQWRWWSPLLDSPQALQDALCAAVARRRRERVGRDAAAPSPALGAGSA
jgi:hypothetical protein